MSLNLIAICRQTFPMATVLAAEIRVRFKKNDTQGLPDGSKLQGRGKKSMYMYRYIPQLVYSCASRLFRVSRDTHNETLCLFFTSMRHIPGGGDEKDRHL